jgi:hypothetical protein
MELIIRMNIKRQVQSLLPGSLYGTNHCSLANLDRHRRKTDASQRFLSSLSHDFGDGSEHVSKKLGEMVYLCQENVAGAIASRIPDLNMTQC